MKPTEQLHTLVFNTLEQQIAVIDRTGGIVEVNLAWTNFAIENGMPPDYTWTGRKYLASLKKAATSGDTHAEDALNGVRDVIKDKLPSFSLEYPCHSPIEKRWFTMNIRPLAKEGHGLYVISHQNITQRKLAEERVQHQATHDPLTGLANRRHFDDILKTEIRRSARAHSPISLIAVDLDNFKDYNDDFGHPRGDQCLIMIAAILRSAGRRPTDVAARLGGDEFLLLLVEADIDGSQIIAEAIVKAVSGLGMTFGKSGQVSASAGVVSVLPDSQSKVSDLLNEADKALYLAKDAGRNCVMRVEQDEARSFVSIVNS